VIDVMKLVKEKDHDFNSDFIDIAAKFFNICIWLLLININNFYIYSNLRLIIIDFSIFFSLVHSEIMVKYHSLIMTNLSFLYAE
jgi:hypothetical protein